MPPATAIMRVLLGLTLRGMRNIPSSGPAIIVANHGGYLDPIFLQTGTYRPIRYMMTSDFYDVPSIRPIYRFFRGITFLAGRAKVPIVPAWIQGSYDVLPRGRVFPRVRPVSISYGRPLSVRGARDRSLPDRILAAWTELR